jgi:hypothetical protein
MAQDPVSLQISSSYYAGVSIQILYYFKYEKPSDLSYVQFSNYGFRGKNIMKGGLIYNASNKITKYLEHKE